VVMLFPKGLVTSVAMLVAVAAASTPSAAQAAGGRQAMQQCVTRVLSGLARQQAPDTQVGSAVLSRCDGPLRTALADAIQTGEAANCTVESCLDMARSRAAAEAIQAYRQHGHR
jgi:ABC-type transporter MlaC component